MGTVLVADTLGNRILVLAPVGRDAELLTKIADKGDLQVSVCPDPGSLCEEILRGAGAVFMTEEALYLPNSDKVAKCVHSQEPWSDLPFVVLTSRGADANERVAATAALLEPLGNVTVIERPVRPATILTALRAALRNRQKQYEVRRRINELRSSYDRLSMTLRAASAGSWEWTVERQRVHWSPEFYEIFGIDPINPPANELLLARVHKADLAALRDTIKTAVNLKQDFRVEFRYLHPEKGLRWAASFGKALTEDGEFLGMAGIALDITERKLVQEELEQRVKLRTRELTAANEEMQGFTYSVSHDLRAPLRAIVSTSKILMEELGDKLNQEHVELLERQALNANKLGDLIDELLKMSRLSRQEMQLSDIDLSAIANEVAQEVTSRSINPDCKVRVQPGMQATGDERLIRLLLQNLIENACKFSPAGGTVWIGTQCNDGQTVFFVKDSGIGFEMRYAPKLFKPFERLVSDDEYPGTGIGLANVQRIAARHGGTAWAESDGDGKGSTFFFTLGPYMA